MSLNPPQGAEANIEAFEQAIEQIEKKLGLDGQPRAIVFHEKDGRRHAHAVWSRIDTDGMRAINLPFYKDRLRDVSRELFLEHGWDMPCGLEDRRLRDPPNFTRAEWQQARRAGLDPKELKAVFRKAWEASDNREAFEQALKERGFWLAKGDRRGFVAVDYRGEVYSVARCAGVKAKDVRARFGDPRTLSSVDQVKIEIADRMTAKIETFIKQINAMRPSGQPTSTSARRNSSDGMPKSAGNSPKLMKRVGKPRHWRAPLACQKAFPASGIA